ncbi:MAG TPA: STAS domain-containing protein [Nocardioidaceae bacterium]|nr:STAS domain-containing protein [Nocardioidaceae bacterium]
MSREEIRKYHQDGHAVVTLSGDFDLANSDRLHELLHGELDLSPRHLVLDVTGVTFMDSTALGVILGARNQAAEKDKTLALVGASDAVARLLHITQIDRVIPTFSDVESAISAS